MFVLKKSLFMNILALPIVGMVCLTSFSTNAVAGFKWTAPSAPMTQFPKEGLKSQQSQPVIHWGKGKDTPAAQEEAPAVEDALPAPVTMETLATLEQGGISETETTDKEKNTTKTMPMGDVISDVVHEDKENQKNTTAASDSKTTKTVVATPDFKIEGAKDIQGFGTNIPLVMALRQIIPTDHPFAFEKGIDLAQLISWDGGKAWPDVLNNTLSSISLAATQYNNMIMIGAAKMETVSIPDPAPTTPTVEKITEDMDILETEPAAPLWRAYKGQTLHSIITAWSEREGVEIFWGINYDYRLHKDVLLEGSYEKVLGDLLNKFSDLSPQPYGQLTKDEDGQRILTIKIYDSMG